MHSPGPTRLRHRSHGPSLPPSSGTEAGRLPGVSACFWLLASPCPISSPASLPAGEAVVMLARVPLPPAGPQGVTVLLLWLSGSTSPPHTQCHAHVHALPSPPAPPRAPMQPSSSSHTASPDPAPLPVTCLWGARGHGSPAVIRGGRRRRRRGLCASCALCARHTTQDTAIVRDHHTPLTRAPHTPPVFEQQR